MRPWDRLYRLREQRGQQPQWVCADRSPIMLLRALERTCWALGVGHWHHSWHSFSHGYTWLDQKSENQSHFHFQRAATAPRGRPPCAPAAARSCPVVFSLHLVPAACRRAMHRGPLSLLYSCTSTSRAARQPPKGGIPRSSASATANAAPGPRAQAPACAANIRPGLLFATSATPVRIGA